MLIGLGKAREIGGLEIPHLYYLGLIRLGQ